MPVVPSPGSAADLALSLLNSTDLSKGAGQVGRAIRHINSVAELVTLNGRYNGDQVYLAGYFSGSPGVGDGMLRWDASSTATPDNGTIFQAVAATGRWIRPLGKAVFLEWFGIVGDGVTLEDARVRAAVAATPQGGTLFMPLREMTVLLDIPAGQSTRWQSAVNLDKPGMKVIGSHACVFKLQDFTSAYVAYSGVTALTAFRASASRVEINGLQIDANADHHYELDGGGFKFWETGPLNKRPPNGISVTVDDDQPNAVGVRIKNCLIQRPLAGCYASGNLTIAAGTSMDDPTFFTGVLATNCIEDVQFIGNEVRNARGNDYIFVAGVRNSHGYDNVSVDSMYHQYRIYAGAVGCTFNDNKAYMSYARIAARWNETDLGYYRTNNPASPNYLIQRCGYTIGSSSANTSANGGNIVRCEMANNMIVFASNSDTAGIADVTQATMTSFFAWTTTNGIKLVGNRSFNSPHRGLSSIISVTSANPEAHGVVISDNIVENCRREAIYALGKGAVFTRNECTNCGADGSGIPVVYAQGGPKIYRNSIIWQRVGEVHAGIVFQAVAYGSPAQAAFVSDNVVLGYTGTRMSKDAALAVHGTDGGGVALTLLAGWTAGPEPARITIDCAGRVQLEGYINSAGGGTDTFATLGGDLLSYIPRDTQRFPVINSTGTVTVGISSDSGNVAATRGALAAGTSFSVTASWMSDFRA